VAREKNLMKNTRGKKSREAIPSSWLAYQPFFSGNDSQYFIYDDLLGFSNIFLMFTNTENF
jgi:hypothetical protein